MFPVSLVPHGTSYINTNMFKWNLWHNPDRHTFDTFPIQYGLKQGIALSPMLSNFALKFAIRYIQANRRDWNWVQNVSFMSMQITLI
jgi:hypothetical protein